MKLLTRGMEWESIPSNVFSVNYHSKDSKYQIFKGKRPTDKFRLVAFDHDPSPQFPQAEFWMREFSTIEEAAKQAEMM